MTSHDGRARGRAPTHSPLPVFVNARFESRRATGVDVHAAEVVRRLHGLERISPPARCADGILGHAWEQTVLPFRVDDGVLWSPCNTGPVLARRHVLTLHDVAPFDVAEHYSPAYRAMARTTMAATSRRASVVATVSQFSADRIVDRLGVAPDRVHVVGNGLREPFLSAATRRTEQPCAEPAVVTLGSLDPRKRLSSLLEAHRRGLPDVELQVIGGGNDRVFASHGPARGARVRMLGYLPTEEVVGRIATALAFVSFSSYEGFGMPPLEAAALGTPVIVSDIPAHREVLGGLRGVHFAADEEQLVMLLRAAARHELSRPVPSDVARRHDWNRVAERYLEVFDLVAGVPHGVGSAHRHDAGAPLAS